MAEFRMPSLGADMDEGTVIEWLVQPGDIVGKGDPVAVVDTDKAAIEVETFTAGTIGQILVPVGERVHVGTPLAIIDGTEPKTGRAHPAGQQPGQAVHPPQSEAGTRPPAGADAARGAAPERIKASPYARKLAQTLHVELAAVPATGQRGLITSEDVRRFAGTIPASDHRRTPVTPQTGPAAQSTKAAPQRAPAARHVVEKSQRAAIARLMARSAREIPHYHLSGTVDLATALDWLTRTNRELPVTDRLVPAALLLKATALAAHRHPELNGFWTEHGFQAAGQVHLGVAISLRGGGLVAPALHDAADLPVGEVMAGLRDLVERARSGRLRRTELTDATITVTNLGDQGVESVHGIIYPPQVALVGAGRIVERPWAVDGLLGVRPCQTLTLAADHRATDGFTGGRFLATIEHLLQTPEEL
ncbi:dihydrolipoamide acetyltransferase family protein [Kribbella solani]|uniref:Dihydrolipoamide acetyltransferase component of pyruvate dehydrogenase complex n=1 Tax=Kribbella solani TaxID=236067 RepID=A0A841DKN7_9ACTN|nr:dihydrolipoamide acetyltransferase family protein [Kribbella solani]MBB5978461.1 pyruvate dehydrogenase E2 component (dihydrolipoamide acetyltransferase) [Kribbella solani]